MQHLRVQQTTNQTASLTIKVSNSIHESPSSILRQEPICFIDNTGSITYTIDTAANRIVVTEVGILTNLKISKSKIKGMGGKGIKIAGTGKLVLPLKSDSGDLDVISNLDAVFVPSCPYNLIPPQILIRQMKSQGYRIKNFLHNDLTYVFKYTSPNNHHKPKRTLTISIQKNGMFQFCAYDGFDSFTIHDPHYCQEYKSFAGVAHFIINDSSISSTSDPLSHTSNTPLS